MGVVFMTYRKGMVSGMLLSPSILSCDFARLTDAVARVECSGADELHLDVMDGVFVPNLTFGAPVIRCLRPLTPLFFDTHLMLQHPERLVDDFIAAGADCLTFHLESDAPVEDLIAHIHQSGKQAGLSLNPDTPLDALMPYLPLVDRVLVMTVQPGFGGQVFQDHVLEKTAALRKEIDRRHLSAIIEVDGGVHRQNAARLVDAGVDMAVMGSAFFADSGPAGLTNLFHSL